MEHPFPIRKVRDSHTNMEVVKYENHNPLPKNKKLVVTQKGLDDWLAQNFGMEINSIPMTKPLRVPVHIYL